MFDYLFKAMKLLKPHQFRKPKQHFANLNFRTENVGGTLEELLKEIEFIGAEAAADR